MESFLKIGSRGSAVRDMQRSLGIASDGIFGPETEAAVRGFQMSQGLRADGIVGPHTIGRLIGVSLSTDPNSIPKSTLKQGMRGPEVAAVQRILGVQSDGIFGPQTRAALQRFQRDNGLDADGVFGPKSRSRMFGEDISSKPLPPFTLSRGMKGYDVAKLQYDLGVKPTGTFTQETVTVLKDFQKKNGLTPDGKYGPKSREVMSRHTEKLPGYKPPSSLPSNFILKRGMQNDGVKDLQRRLGIREDTGFGPKTLAAVKGFQHGAGLTVNGQVNPATWAQMSAIDTISTECPEYHLPAVGVGGILDEGRSRISSAKDILDRTDNEWWVININHARQAYAEIGGNTKTDLTKQQVGKILEEVKKSVVLVEDKKEWEDRMAYYKAKGLTAHDGSPAYFNNFGISNKCSILGGDSSDPKRILINPYIMDEQKRFEIQYHELEHAIKLRAGVPIEAEHRGVSVHHWTSMSDMVPMRLPKPQEKSWFRRLIDLL